MSGQLSATRSVRGPRVSPLSYLAALFALAGFVIIILYGLAESSARLQSISVGLLTAFAALAAGTLFGFLFGIPRYVSSGAFRIKGAGKPSGQTNGTSETSTTKTPSRAGVGAAGGGGAGGGPAGGGGAGGGPAGGGGAVAADAGGGGAGGGGAGDGASGALSEPPNFEPSTNLAEVSDWLTKLLLGAGLVQLTHMGPPLASLINNTAAGLSGTTAASESAKVIAATIMVTYAGLGFLASYMFTTIVYGKLLTGHAASAAG